MSNTTVTATPALTTTPVRLDTDATEYPFDPFVVTNNGPNSVRIGGPTVTATANGQIVPPGGKFTAVLTGDNPIWGCTLEGTANVATAQIGVFTGGGGITPPVGDIGGTAGAPTVVGIGGTLLTARPTGLLKLTTGTGVISAAVAGTDFAAASEPIGAAAQTTANLAAVKTNNLSDLASAATARTNLSVPAVADVTAAGAVTKINGTTLSGLATGILKNTTATGVPVIAVAADIPLAAIGATGPMPAATALNAITVPAAAVAFNAQKITGLANGSAATDGAAFGQIPVASAVLPAFLAIGGVIGVATAWARSDHAHTRDYWTALDYGYAAMSSQPDTVAVASAAMTSGTEYVTMMFLDRITTISQLSFSVQTAGATLTASQCLVGLYDPSGALIGTSSTNSGATDLATALTGTGLQICTLTPAGTGLTSLAVGKYRAVISQVGTTPAILRAPTNSTMVNGKLAAAASKYGQADTGRTTTLVAALGAVTAFSGANWFAIN